MTQENSVATQKPTGLKAFNQFITSPKTQSYLDDVLKERKASFVSNMVALVANNHLLQPCESQSLMFSCLKAVSLGLSVDPALGMAHIIPRKDNNRGIVQATFQIGAKGIKQLAIRSGQFLRLNYGDVREGEKIGEDFLSGDIQFEKLTTNRLDAPIVGYFAYAKLKNGFEKTLYMTNEEILAHAKRFSQAYRYGNSLWNKDESFPAMAKKTVAKLLLNSGDFPLSIELQDAFQADQSVITEKGYDYVDNRNKIEEAQASLASSMFEQAIGDAQEVEIVEELHQNEEGLFDDTLKKTPKTKK